MVFHHGAHGLYQYAALHKQMHGIENAQPTNFLTSSGENVDVNASPRRGQPCANNISSAPRTESSSKLYITDPRLAAKRKSKRCGLARNFKMVLAINKYMVNNSGRHLDIIARVSSYREPTKVGTCSDNRQIAPGFPLATLRQVDKTNSPQQCV